jgi:ribosomal-protein-alanine N-acetyltransferase
MGLRKGVELSDNEFNAFSIADADELYELDRVCRLSPWSREGFSSELKESHTLCFGKRDDQGISAFIMSHVYLDEAHILKIGVRPDVRRHGIASRLLNYTVAQFLACGVKSAYLEVRRSQTSARALYEKNSFVLTGERKNYYGQEEGYPDGTEDAILYTLSL